MFYGKKKAITFSYDDGVLQDRRTIDILNKYGLKATFNLNSGLLGLTRTLKIETNGGFVDHSSVQEKDVKYIYEGHEVAAHTLTHPFLPKQSDEEITRQVEKDRLALSEMVGYEVIGMAYPCGGANSDNRVAQIIRKTTGIQYARTITSTHSFDLQNNLYGLNPTLHHDEALKQLDLIETFLSSKFDAPALLYIWGHSFEFDARNTWDSFEELCRMLSGRQDVFYGTNKEVFGLI